ncbi:MAG TPA: YbaB/EbfC family nucleoid-associated protein [Stenomitos sp.]
MRGGMGGMGGMDMQKLMKQAQKMQEDLLKAQENLGSQTVEGTSGGGAVTVVANGHKEITAVRIKPEAVDPEDIETLEDLVLTAIRDAQGKANALAENQMGSMMPPGMNLPGFGR